MERFEDRRNVVLDGRLSQIENPRNRLIVLALHEERQHVEPPSGQDGWKENNTAINFLYLKGEGKVLLVTDPQGEARDWETLVKALKSAKRLVEVKSAFESQLE